MSNKVSLILLALPILGFSLSFNNYVLLGSVIFLSVIFHLTEKIDLSKSRNELTLNKQSLIFVVFVALSGLLISERFFSFNHFPQWYHISWKTINLYHSISDPKPLIRGFEDEVFVYYYGFHAVIAWMLKVIDTIFKIHPTTLIVETITASIAVLMFSWGGLLIARLSGFSAKRIILAAAIILFLPGIEALLFPFVGFGSDRYILWPQCWILCENISQPELGAQLAWAPQHNAFLTLQMYFFLRGYQNETLRTPMYLLVLFSSLVVSPFITLYWLALIAGSYLEKLSDLKKQFTLTNILLGLIAFLIALTILLFYKTKLHPEAIVLQSWASWYTIPKTFYFLIAENIFILAVIIVFKMYHDKRVIFLLCVLMLSAFVKIGLFNDLYMRGSAVPVLALFLLVTHKLLINQNNKALKYLCVLALTLGLSVNMASHIIEDKGRNSRIVVKSGHSYWLVTPSPIYNQYIGLRKDNLFR